MKNAKRILSFLIAMAMLISCFAVVAVADEAAATAETTVSLGNSKFSDVPDTAPYVTAVGVLNSLGVINGFPDGTFRPDQNVTRAEFTAMLMRTLNYGSLGKTTAKDLPFTDIDDNDTSINWAIPNINTAYDKGIINGYEDNTFRPNANVAYEEAVKMVVCTLGYTNIDASGTPWYGNYLAQANKIGILKGAASLGQAETPASRACIAQMLYDSLDVNILENDKISEKTILSDYLGYIKNVGVVSSDGITSMSSPDVMLNNNEVEITAYEKSTGLNEVHRYRTSDDSLKQHLGYQVEFYYKTDGANRTLALYVLKENKVLEIDASLVELSQSTDTQIKYYENADSNSLKTVNINSSNTVIYNGKLYGANSAASVFNKNTMIPAIGKLEFIDSDGNSTYDVIKIEGYDVYYVSKKVASEYYIVDDILMPNGEKTLYLDVENSSDEVSIVNTSGSKMDFSAIPTGAVICLASSKNPGIKFVKAIVVNNTVSGTITATDKDSVTISGKEYKFSNAAPWVAGTPNHPLVQPALGDSGSYSLDLNGDIVAYKKNAVSDNIYYGYIMGMNVKSAGFEQDVEVRIINQNGSVITISMTGDTKVNGQSFGTGAGAASALEYAASLQNTNPSKKQQLIKYSTRNSGGKTILDEIYTAELSDKEDPVAEKLGMYKNISATMTDGVDASGNPKPVRMSYNSTTKQLSYSFSNGDAKEIITVSNAVVFTVPKDRDITGIKKVSIASAFKDGKLHAVEAFDVSKTGYAKVIVLYETDDAPVLSTIDYTSPVYVIADDVVSDLNPNENITMSYLKGFKSDCYTPKSEFTGWLADNSEYKNLGVGTIFRAVEDGDGYLNIPSKEVIYSVGGVKNFGVLSNNASTFSSDNYSVVMGSVVAVDENAITITAQELNKGDIIDNSVITIPVAFSNISGARVLKYDDTTGRNLQIKDVSSEYDAVLAGLVGYDEVGQQTNPAKVIVYMYRGNVKLMCILGENL